MKIFGFDITRRKKALSPVDQRGGWWPLGDGNGRLDPELVTALNFHRRLCGILYGVRTPETNK